MALDEPDERQAKLWEIRFSYSSFGGASGAIPDRKLQFRSNEARANLSTSQKGIEQKQTELTDRKTESEASPPFSSTLRSEIATEDGPFSHVEIRGLASPPHPTFSTKTPPHGILKTGWL